MSGQRCDKHDRHFDSNDGDCPACVEEAANVKTGVELIAEERARQVSKEGWTPQHDDDHQAGELAQAAGCYTLLAARQAQVPAREIGPQVPSLWPWDGSWWKPKDQLRNLVRAGALIAAEIDRLQRENAP